MFCAGCAKWCTKRTTTYDDGSEIVGWQAPEGKGLCAHLNTETTADFGCNAWQLGLGGTVENTHKIGAPWQHSRWDVCPTCKGKGLPENEIREGIARHCPQCIGVGKVLYYDDGYIGENKFRRHPKEPRVPLKCVGCEETLEGGWLACPHCGVKTELGIQRAKNNPRVAENTSWVAPWPKVETDAAVMREKQR